MIARIWRGRAPPATADDYQHHFLRREDSQEVMFTTITCFTSLDAVRAFAGDGYERAVVEQATRQVLSRRDERASHHEVAVDLQ